MPVSLIDCGITWSVSNGINLHKQPSNNYYSYLNAYHIYLSVYVLDQIPAIEPQSIRVVFDVSSHAKRKWSKVDKVGKDQAKDDDIGHMASL